MDLLPLFMMLRNSFPSSLSDWAFLEAVKRMTRENSCVI